MRKLLLLLMLILLPTVYGIGIAPAYHEIFFEPGNEMEMSFRVINNERKEMDVMIYSKGELSNSIEIPSKIHIRNDELEKTVDYSLILPLKMAPGENILSIYVVESNLEDADIDIVKTNLGVVYKLKVYVPYPGEYLQGMMFIEGTKQGEIVTFTLGLNNLGTEKLNDIKGAILIKDAKGRGVSQIITSTTSLSSNEKGKIIGEWKSAENGKYVAQAIVSYNEEVLLIEKELEIGEAQITIKDIRVVRFKLGDIARLDILLENSWNEEIKNVQTKTVIFDEASNEISSFDSSPIDIGTQSIKEVPSYWETQEVQPGKYILNIVLDYMDKKKEKSYEIAVDEDSLVFLDSATGNVISSEKKNVSYLPLIILISIILMTFAASIILPKLKHKAKTFDIDPKVKEYISYNLSQGISIKAIKLKMLQSGYKEDYIDQAILALEERKI